MGYYDHYKLFLYGIKIQDEDIIRGSYSFHFDFRVMDSYQDATGTLHEFYSKDKKAKISFKMREHDDSDLIHVKMQMMCSVKRAKVTFYNDITGQYQEGNFKIDYASSDPIVRGNKIHYKDITFTLEEL